ncbi:hypothetical protein Celaphus_00009852, partial [Cervus elaphus hippelaphus]
VGGPKAGRAWGNPKRGTKSRLNVAVDRQWPPREARPGCCLTPSPLIKLMMVRAFIPKKEARPSSTALRIPGTHSDTRMSKAGRISLTCQALFYPRLCEDSLRLRKAGQAGQ